MTDMRLDHESQTQRVAATWYAWGQVDAGVQVFKGGNAADFAQKWVELSREASTKGCPSLMDAWNAYRALDGNASLDQIRRNASGRAHA